jgi:hypothetical protein
MSFKAAIRAHLFSDAAVTSEVSESGTLGVALSAGAITEITVSGLTSAPAATGQVLLKNAAGKYEFVNYTASTVDGADYDLTVSATIVNSYAQGDYVAMCIGIYSFPAPQSATFPYALIQRIATSEIYNRLDSPGMVVVETWQLSCYSDTDDACETLKEDIVAALNLVNPTTWSDDGFATGYSVYTSVFESETTIPDAVLDGSQDQITHKPVTFTIIRSISAS